MSHAGTYRRIFLSIIISFIAMVIISCNNSHHDTIKLKILQTSDVHGAIFPYDFILDKPSFYSLAQVYTYVKEMRQINDSEVIFLDNGDILQGQPTVYYSNFEDHGEPHICSKVMNYMQYDGATVGNHDIEAGPEVYNALQDEFHFPWMAANAINRQTNEPYFRPYMIVEREGIRIAVLGLITPGIPEWLPEILWKGMYFTDMVETAAYWVPIIQDREQPDVLIGLFHSGHDASYSGQADTASMNENASLIVAEQVPGFDVIFIGHDHDTYNGFVINRSGDSVLVLDPGSHARFVSEATIRLKWDPDKKEYSRLVSGKLVPSDGYDPDPEFMNTFADEFEQIKAYVSRPAGHLDTSIASADALFGDTPFMDLIHEVQLEISGAQISFAAPLSFNALIDSGTLFVRDFFQLYRFENFLYSMKLTGQEIHDYLEYSYGLWMQQMGPDDRHLLLFHSDDEGKLIKFNTSPFYRLRNPYYNFDSAEGIVYTVDVSKPEGERVRIHAFCNGTPFERTGEYIVAINSYRGNGGGGHLVRGAGIGEDELSGRVVYATDHDLRLYMMKWMESAGNYHPETNHNWEVIPEEWWEKGAENDREILFHHNH